MREGATGIELLNIFYIFSYKWIYIPYIFSILVLCAVISGYYPRITCIFHAWISYSVFHSLLIVEGGDQITAILTLLIIPACLTDNRKNHWIRNNDYIIPNDIGRHFVRTSLIFVRVQMALLYLDAGVEKLKVTEWVDGTATYYWFTHNIFGAPDWMRYLFTNAFSHQYFVTTVTWGVILLEISLFAGLFIQQKYRYLLLGFASIFHFLIFIVHGLPTFMIAMWAGLLMYLLPLNKDWQLVFTEIRRKLAKPPPPPAYTSINAESLYR
jgi:antimicrobial peptide system SdpB family protein